MELDAEALAKQMLGAALPILKKNAEDAQSFAQIEFTKIAHDCFDPGNAGGGSNQPAAGYAIARHAEERLTERAPYGARTGSAGCRGSDQRCAQSDKGRRKFGRQIPYDPVVVNATSCEAKQSKMGKGDLEDQDPQGTGRKGPCTAQLKRLLKKFFLAMKGRQRLKPVTCF